MIAFLEINVCLNRILHECSAFFLQMRESKFQVDTYVKGFGVQVDPNMVQVEGRVLKTPGIIYGGVSKILSLSSQSELKHTLFSISV